MLASDYLGAFAQAHADMTVASLGDNISAVRLGGPALEASLAAGAAVDNITKQQRRRRGKESHIWFKDFPEHDPDSNYPAPSAKQVLYEEEAQRYLNALKEALRHLTVPQTACNLRGAERARLQERGAGR